jgi:tRNA(fMet)-specific endonuclease VapC
VLGELYFGAAKSDRPSQNAARIDDFTGSSGIVIGIDGETARLYGSIKAELKRQGKPVPENDIWIAASARQHGLTLVTRDRHFQHIRDLLIEVW